jgi:hypothetical protein
MMSRRRGDQPAPVEPSPTSIAGHAAGLAPLARHFVLVM